MLGVEGALVVVGVDAGELDLVAGLADVAEVAEQDGVFRAGESAGGNLLSKMQNCIRLSEFRRLDPSYCTGASSHNFVLCYFEYDTFTALPCPATPAG